MEIHERCWLELLRLICVEDRAPRVGVLMPFALNCVSTSAGPGSELEEPRFCYATGEKGDCAAAEASREKMGRDQGGP